MLVVCNTIWEEPVGLDLGRKTYSGDCLPASFSQCGEQVPRE
jgi:hypothetical protein